MAMMMVEMLNTLSNDWMVIAKLSKILLTTHKLKLSKNHMLVYKPPTQLSLDEVK